MKLPRGHIQSEDQGEEWDIFKKWEENLGRRQGVVSGERGTVEPENWYHDSPNWLTAWNLDEDQNGQEQKAKLWMWQEIIIGILVHYQKNSARVRRMCIERRLIFLKKFFYERREEGSTWENYHLEIPFYSFVICNEYGNNENDDIFTGFRIRETLVCIWAQGYGFHIQEYIGGVGEERHKHKTRPEAGRNIMF